MAIEVRTKKELAMAVKKKENEIIVCNPNLAKKLIMFKGMSKQSVSQHSPEGTLPPTMACTLAGIEFVYIVGIIVIGVVVLYSIYKDYDVEIKSGDDSFILKRASVPTG